MPREKLDAAIATDPPTGAAAAGDAGAWKCWQCASCENCGVSFWATPLLHLDLRRLDEDILAETIRTMCGMCLYKFKKTKEFCPICFRSYSDESPAEPDKALVAAEGMDSLACGGHNGVRDKEDEEVADNNRMVQCNECARWVHALCEGIDQAQYEAMTNTTHPVWGFEYLCPICRVNIRCLIFPFITLLII